MKTRSVERGTTSLLAEATWGAFVETLWRSYPVVIFSFKAIVASRFYTNTLLGVQVLCLVTFLEPLLRYGVAPATISPAAMGGSLVEMLETYAMLGPVLIGAVIGFDLRDTGKTELICMTFVRHIDLVVGRFLSVLILHAVILSATFPYVLVLYFSRSEDVLHICVILVNRSVMGAILLALAFLFIPHVNLTGRFHRLCRSLGRMVFCGLFAGVVVNVFQRIFGYGGIYDLFWEFASLAVFGILLIARSLNDTAKEIFIGNRSFANLDRVKRVGDRLVHTDDIPD